MVDLFLFEFDPWPNGQDTSANHVAFSETTNLAPLAQTDLLTLVLDHTEAGLTVFQGYLGFTAATGLVTGAHSMDDLLVIVDP